MIKRLRQVLVNLPGWRTRRKIVVFESDDWGSIRMPSQEVYVELLKLDIRVDQLAYNRYDSLAREEDLVALFEVLGEVQDSNRRTAIITANTIVANPDFPKIKESGYHDYYFEPFTVTLQRYPGCQGAFNKWQEGMVAGVFKPQYHGREHLNVHRWMRALRENRGQVRLAFEHGMFDLSTSLIIGENSFMETLNLEAPQELDYQQTALLEGLDLFEQLFGYRAITFIAPCYTWSSQLEEPLAEAGIKAWQGSWFQREPKPGVAHRFRKRFHYTGQRNMHGQYYLVRNAAFEPAERPDVDWVDEVLRRLEVIFRMGKPAIIGTHRINFIGAIDPANRDRNLLLFHRLLKGMTKRWPDIEFMSSDQLVKLIDEDFQS